MLLENYYKASKYVYELIGYNSPSQVVTVKLTDGSESTLGTYQSGMKDPLMFQIYSLTSSNYIYTTLPQRGSRYGGSLTVVFGNNDTPATYTDYTTTAIPNIVWHSSTVENGGILFMFRNNNSTPITIKDILLCGNICTGTDSSYVYAIYREVLSEPITVEAGNYFTFFLKKTYGE